MSFPPKTPKKKPSRDAAHLVVLALVLEGLGAAVGGGLAFLCGSGHPEACEA